VNDPIYPAIVFFLVLGAIIGWLLRQLWDRGQVASVEQSWRTRVNTMREREQARSDQGSARGAAPAPTGGTDDRAEALQRELDACRRVSEERRTEIQRLQDRLTELEKAAAETTREIEGEPPERIPAPAAPDDLKQISGIGPGIERTLNGLGIYRFHQIAAFTSDNVVWVDRQIGFRGRIGREKWIEQAKALAGGES
jgi:NADH-quinone oxidoreductase subunit E